MNANLSKKLITTLIVVLLIANAATIAMVVFKKEERRPIIPGGPANYIIKTLNFNKEQQAAYFELVTEHQQAIGPLRTEIKEAKDDLFALLKEPNVNEATKTTAIQKIAAFTSKVDQVTFEHFAKVRKLCNPEQQKQFDDIIKQVVQMMGMPHGGPPPGGPHHDGPPPGHPEGHPGEHPPF